MWYSPAWIIGISSLRIETAQFLGKVCIMMGILIDIQLVLLFLAVARLPVALYAVSVVLLTVLHVRVVFFAGPQAVVLAIVASAWWQDVLLNVGGWAWLHIPWHNFLTAQNLACQLSDGRLVHRERCLTPHLAVW